VVHTVMTKTDLSHMWAKTSGFRHISECSHFWSTCFYRAACL